MPGTANLMLAAWVAAEAGAGEQPARNNLLEVLIAKENSLTTVTWNQWK